MARAIVEGLFEVDAEGHLTLLGGYSPSSGRHHFPRSEVCPYTGADDVVPARLSGHGTLWAWTAVTARPAGYAGPVPYGFGVVELPEGLRVVGRITEPDPEQLAFGQRMAVVAEELPGEDGEPVVVWAFTPSPEGGA
ncbi:MAG: OB-fold domain-containing protein [Acidimicrobiales bacterium]|jgi:uncharacterized OB-fold protein|nr:OB-fold domain-containing protein [Acidimicrobiales bacterium]